MSLLSGYFVDSLGRKATMMLSNFLLIIACILVQLAPRLVPIRKQDLPLRRPLCRGNDNGTVLVPHSSVQFVLA